MMKTENLVTMLANDQESVVVKPAFGRFASIGLVVALSMVLVLQGLTGMGIRSDYNVAIWHIGAFIKQLMPLVLAVVVLPFVAGAYRPDVTLNRGYLRALPYLLVMGLAFIGTWAITAPDAISATIFHPASIKCVTLVPVFSIPAYVGLLYVMRQGAPANPTKTGFWAGLAAGGFGCFAYAFGCDMDSPLYFAVWYSTGILISGVLGAIVGSRLLRW